MERPLVSVVLPVYNERANLAPVLAEVAAALSSRPYEIVAVDDGSDDGSLAELRRLQAAHPALRVLGLARHFGQSSAVVAGVDAARGEVVVTMDADGQNDPAEIPRLLEPMNRECPPAAAVGYRVHRADSPWKRFQGRFANRVRNWITGDRIRDTGCALKAMRRSALSGLPRFDGMHRFLPTLIRVGGGEVVEIPVSHRRRRSGHSKYGMWDRAWRGLYDALAIRWLRRRTLHYVLKEDPR